MDFVDRILVSLTDEGARQSIFDELALAQILSAAYDVGALGAEGPYSATFDELRPCCDIQAVGSVEGAWAIDGEAARTRATFALAGVGAEPIVIDALWRGAIVARVSIPDGRVAEVGVRWPETATIDASIAADSGGSLPADAAALDLARRARLLTAVRATMADPGGFTDTHLDQWLRATGAFSASDFLERTSRIAGATTVRLTFSETVSSAASPRALPVCAGLLIRDAGASLRTLLAESRRVRRAVESLGITPPAAALHRRHQSVVVWVLPAETFDDPDWPGATAGATGTAAREARRAAAGPWLAREGIGLTVAS